jgi:hypothetical protein
MSTPDEKKKRERSRPSHWKVLHESNFSESALGNQWQLYLFVECSRRSEAESWFPQLHKQRIPYFLASYGRMDERNELMRVFGVFVPTPFVTGRQKERAAAHEVESDSDDDFA